MTEITAPATAAVTAPAPPAGGRASAHDPRHTPAVAQRPRGRKPDDPVVLSLADAERLRTKLLDLISFAQEVGIFQLAVSVHSVSRLSAWEVLPEGTEEIRRVNDRAYGLRELEVGHHDVKLYTGDVGVDAIAGVAP